MFSKYADNLAFTYYADADMADDVIGSVDEMGWYGLFRWANGGGVILNEDNYGFVTAWAFDTDPELNEEWDSITQNYADFYAE